MGPGAVLCSSISSTSFVGRGMSIGAGPDGSGILSDPTCKGEGMSSGRRGTSTASSASESQERLTCTPTSSTETPSEPD
eukprot:CAMPEP_0115332454 /NCGR_PEP_ID=MMETSP0270-20121206/86848_1 /TAXON_ID=71861 /ORGANISM="Scrippsiella trochoidea, Strain CCMP3099" /LENGTH=78 /DNA_ID=CAMNT_0002753295 /DNA_START=35 /DNA_END=271 /DNA_ORIENTATION=-